MGMKSRARVTAMLLAVGAAGCGSDEPNRQEFAQQADKACRQAADDFNALGPNANAPAAAAAQSRQITAVVDREIARFKEIEAPKDLESDWKRYIGLVEQLNAANRRRGQAVARNDRRALAKVERDAGRIQQQRLPLVQKLGLKVCGNPRPIPISKPQAPAPPRGVDFPQPSEPIVAAVTRLQQAAASGRCERLRSLQHSDDQPIPTAVCRQILLGPLRNARPVGTAEYGTAAVADLDNGQLQTTALFVLDEGGRWGLSTLLGNEGGSIKKPRDEDRADANIEALVGAIRDDDAKAFNALLSEESTADFREKGPGVKLANTSRSGPRLVEDLRADETARPERLGINQAFAFYALEADGSYYTLIEQLGPTGYKFSGFYPAKKG